MASAITPDRMSVRMGLVEEHVRCENAHDLDGVMNTFGPDASYHDEPWNDRRAGRDGVREYYADLMRAVPDFSIEVLRRHVSDEHIMLEVMIRGTQCGTWRGLPPTGRRVEVPLCGIYTFDENDRLASERIYYDRATVLRQLGVFHEPDGLVGKLTTVLAHPVTMARIVARALRRHA